MHILILSEGYAPETDARASRITEHARLWVKMGHRVTVITQAPNFPRGVVYEGYTNVWRSVADDNGVTLVRIWSFLYPNKGIALRLTSFLCFMVMAFWHGWCLTRNDKPDVVIGTCPSLFAPVAAAALARVIKRPFVYEVRDLWPESAVAIGMIREHSLPYTLLRSVARWLYRQANLLVPVGEGYAAQIRDGYPETQQTPAIIIPNGVDLERFIVTTDKASARRALGLPLDRFIVLYIGTMGRSQRLETLLETADRLAAEPQRITLVLAGDGEERPRLEAALAAKPRANIILLPPQSKDGVIKCYNACDASVSVLRRSPVFVGRYPAKMFEAMAMAKPLILSGEGISAEQLKRADAGIVTPPEDSVALGQAIRQLASDTAQCTHYGQNGRAFIAKYYQRGDLARRYAEALAVLAS